MFSPGLGLEWSRMDESLFSSDRIDGLVTTGSEIDHLNPALNPVSLVFAEHGGYLDV